MTDKPGRLEDLALRDEPREADAHAVREIVSSTGFFSPAEIEIAVELVRERLEKGEGSGYHFVFADFGGQVVGYACYGPIPGTESSFDLYWVAVLESCRGRGIGGLLMEAAESAVRRMGGTRIYVDTSSRGLYLPTRRFYERCGYRQEASLQDFYSPADDKLIYVKEL